MTLRHLTFALAAGTAMSLLSLTAPAALASDAHCFDGPGYAPLEPEDRYAAGTMEDEEQIAAMEDLIEAQWKLRMTGLPLSDVAPDGRPAGEGEPVFDPLTRVEAAIVLNNESELDRRRTGSKYIYVSPEMKRLARQRAQLRSLKRKPCNPHVLYLGGY